MATAASPPTSPERPPGMSPSQNREYFEIAQGPYPTARGGGPGSRWVGDRSGNRIASAAVRGADLSGAAPRPKGEWPAPGAGPRFKGRPRGQVAEGEQGAFGDIPSEGGPPPRNPDPSPQGARPRDPDPSQGARQPDLPQGPRSDGGQQGGRPRSEGGQQGGRRGGATYGEGRRGGARLDPRVSEATDGPAFFLIRRVDGNSMAGANPFVVRRTLQGICGDVESARAIRSGALLVKTMTGPQNPKLLAVVDFMGEAVEVTEAHRMNSVEGLFYCREVCHLTEENLLGELFPQGVTEVTRLRSRKEGPNPLVRVRFRGLVLPPYLYCGYISSPVRPWVPSPRQCRNCWRFGHLSGTCRSRTVCGRCAEAHSTEDCSSAETRCASCREPHPAWDRSCGAWRAAKERGPGRHGNTSRGAAPPETLLPAQAPHAWPPLGPYGKPPSPLSRSRSPDSRQTDYSRAAPPHSNSKGSTRPPLLPTPTTVVTSPEPAATASSQHTSPSSTSQSTPDPHTQHTPSDASDLSLICDMAESSQLYSITPTTPTNRHAPSPSPADKRRATRANARRVLEGLFENK